MNMMPLMFQEPIFILIENISKIFWKNKLKVQNGKYEQKSQNSSVWLKTLVLLMSCLPSLMRSGTFFNNAWGRTHIHRIYVLGSFVDVEFLASTHSSSRCTNESNACSPQAHYPASGTRFVCVSRFTHSSPHTQNKNTDLQWDSHPHTVPW